jgi:very-short-patch-repair endonuclease
MANADGESARIGQDRHPRDLATRAAKQLGVVSRKDLHALHRNVFAVGHRRIVVRAHLLAAQLSIGPAAFLSHRSAAGVWGLRPINTHDIELTVPGTGGRKRSDLTIHRTREAPHRRDVRQNGHLRVSSVVRLLVELSPRETPAELERLVTVAVQKRLLRPDLRSGLTDIEEALARHDRWPGRATLGAVLARYRRTTSHKSALELAFDRLLARHPEIPEPQRNIHIGRWEIDRFWPEHRLVVELDGRPYHMSVRDMEKDRVKDADLQRRGCIPLRFTDFRVEHDPPGILDDLRYFLKLSR